MTRKIKFNPLAVLSAYSGVLLCKFDEMHEYIEVVMDRPVFTHELGSNGIFYILVGKIKDRGDFDRALKMIEEALAP